MISEAHNVDCREYMKAIPDGFFNLAVVDPPYGIGSGSGASLNVFEHTCKRLRRYTGNRKNRLSAGAGKLKDRVLQTMNSEWDNLLPTPEYFEELFRISKNQIIWGGNYFDLPPTRCVICWDKQQPWENFSQWEMAWTSFDSPAPIFRWRNAGDGEKKIHPTQKPVDLYAWLLKKYTKPGDKIFDSHLGSGSSRIAAYKLGFDFYACELDKDYFDAQEDRFRRECFGEIKMSDGRVLKQQTLFDQ